MNHRHLYGTALLGLIVAIAAAVGAPDRDLSPPLASNQTAGVIEAELDPVPVRLARATAGRLPTSQGASTSEVMAP